MITPLMTQKEFIKKTTTKSPSGKVRGRWAIGGIDKALDKWEKNCPAWRRTSRVGHLIYTLNTCRAWLRKKEGKLAKTDTGANVALRAAVVEELIQQVVRRLIGEEKARKEGAVYKRIAEKKAARGHEPYPILKKLDGMYKYERADFVKRNQERLAAATTQQRSRFPRQNPVSASDVHCPPPDKIDLVIEALQKILKKTATEHEYQTVCALLVPQGADSRCLYMTKAERASQMLIGRDSNGGIQFSWDLINPYSTPDTGAAYALDKWGCLFAYEAERAPTGERVNHSSFNKGRGVICAGDLHVKDGIIVKINNNSGHYRPSYVNLHNAVEVLGEGGVDLSRIEVEVMFREGQPNPYTVNARDFADDINTGCIRKVSRRKGAFSK